MIIPGNGTLGGRGEGGGGGERGGCGGGDYSECSREARFQANKGG